MTPKPPKIDARDVITKDQVIDLIKSIEKVLVEKMGWGHEGVITQIARDQLYGPVDVKMTSTPISTPIKPGHKAKPTNLAKSIFNPPRPVDNTVAKIAPPPHNKI